MSKAQGTFDFSVHHPFNSAICHDHFESCHAFKINMFLHVPGLFVQNTLACACLPSEYFIKMSKHFQGLIWIKINYPYIFTH